MYTNVFSFGERIFLDFDTRDAGLFNSMTRSMKLRCCVFNKSSLVNHWRDILIEVAKGYVLVLQVHRPTTKTFVSLYLKSTHASLTCLYVTCMYYRVATVSTSLTYMLPFTSKGDTLLHLSHSILQHAIVYLYYKSRQPQRLSGYLHCLMCCSFIRQMAQQ